MTDAWGNLHHYCAAKAYMMRANAEREPKSRSFHFEQVIRNCIWSLERTPPSHFLFPEMLTTRAMAHHGRGEHEEAIAQLQQAIRLHPKYANAYSSLAIVYDDIGRKKEAIEALTQGNSATDGGSAEIHYLLGLMLVEQGDIDAAVVQAKEAYERGYPLPGLKRKLERLGRW